MHPIVGTIRSLLDRRAVPYSFLEHAAGSTSEEMAKIRKGYSLSEGSKALIVATDGGFAQIVVPGDTRFSNAKARRLIGTNALRFANEAELSEVTGGVLPGAVPPFGSLFGLPVYADLKLFSSDRMVFNCGERTASIAMRPSDYQAIVCPVVADLSG